MTFLLRVFLPDRPGSLGALAVALGTVGADIISLDVVDRAAGYAVDDIVVEVPRGTLPDTLITAAEHLGGVRVDSLRPFDGLLDVHRELELIDATSAASRTATGPDPSSVIVNGAPAVLRAGWAILLAPSAEKDSSSQGRDPAVTRVDVLAASESAPQSPTQMTLPRSPFTNPSQALKWAPAEWTVMDTAVISAPVSANRALVIGRSGGSEFRPAEIARLQHLCGILGTVLAAGTIPAPAPAPRLPEAL